MHNNTHSRYRQSSRIRPNDIDKITKDNPKIPQTECSDGTDIFMCSNSKPKYCDTSGLVSRSSLCGCPTGQKADKEGIWCELSQTISNCKEDETKTTTCPDGKEVVSEACVGGEWTRIDTICKIQDVCISNANCEKDQICNNGICETYGELCTVDETMTCADNSKITVLKCVDKTPQQTEEVCPTKCTKDSECGNGLQCSEGNCKLATDYTPYIFLGVIGLVVLVLIVYAVKGKKKKEVDNMWNKPTEKQLNSLPKFYSTENVKAEDKIIKMHFFMGGMDWYIAEMTQMKKHFLGMPI